MQRLQEIKKNGKNQITDQQQTALKNLISVGYMEMEGMSVICKYSPIDKNILMSADDTGLVYLINVFHYNKMDRNTQLNPEKIKPQKIIHVTQNTVPIFDADWSIDQKLIIGSGDRNVSVVDVVKSTVLVNKEQHHNSVRTVKSCIYNSSLFLSGGRDGQLFLWDMRQQKNSLIIQNQIIDSLSEPEIMSYTGLAFYCDFYDVLTAQAGDSNIKLWDLRKINNKERKLIATNSQNNNINEALMYQFNDQTATLAKLLAFQDEMNNLLKIKFENLTFAHKQRIYQIKQKYKEKQANQIQISGYTSLFLSKSQRKLLLNTTNSIIMMYKTDQLQTLEPFKFTGHRSNYYLKQTISPCENFVLSGSKDQNMYIWKIEKDRLNNDSPFAIFRDCHQGEINCVDWGQLPFNFISSVSDDKTLLLWDYQN